MFQSIKQRINDLVADHLNGGPEFDFEKNIFDDYGADELDEIEILMALEEMFSVELPDDNYETLNDFLQAVEHQLKA